MEKEFIPYEQALALKELGFDEHCFAYYGEINGGEIMLFLKKNFDNQALYFLAPLYQQAFRWFREKYNYSHSISKTYGGEYIPYANGSELNLDDERFQWIYKTYEEAELECLKKLIEITKNK
jgi:hypothetical protein